MTTAAWLQGLLAGGCVAAAAAYLGSLMITRRMALVGDALGHVALPGMGLALQLGVDPSAGALVCLAAGIGVTWRLSRSTALSTETLVGVVFVTSLALGFLIVPQPELLESLIGDVARISGAGAAAAVGVSAAVAWLVRRIYSAMMLVNLSEELAWAEGIDPERVELLYLVAIALIVSVGVKVTGSLLVGALVIIPPAASRLLCRELWSYVRASVGIAVMSNCLGITAARLTGFAAGPAIILVAAGCFGLALIAGRVRDSGG
jgi:ABC-type Mn2+/Zn2+ transport system permease subunit